MTAQFVIAWQVYQAARLQILYGVKTVPSQQASSVTIQQTDALADDAAISSHADVTVSNDGDHDDESNDAEALADSRCVRTDHMRMHACLVVSESHTC